MDAPNAARIQGHEAITTPLAAVEAEQSVVSSPSWASILPPLFAIGLALAFRQVLVALALGVWLGAFLLEDLSLLGSFARLLDTHLVGAIADRGHASILLFSLLLGGMLGLMTQSGGSRGLAGWVHGEPSTRPAHDLALGPTGLLRRLRELAARRSVDASRQR